MLTVVGIIGSIASVGGLYAVYDNRKNKRFRLLAYERTGSLALATASDVERDYKLSVQYQAPGGQSELIDAAYVTYLRFANFGREPVRRDDIAPASPLRIEAKAERVLDISLVSQRRSVTRVQLEDLRIEGEDAHCDVVFDYLDYHDGAIVRILSTSRTLDVRLVGEIIGMPSGIVRSDQSPASFWGKLGVGLWLTAELGAFAGALIFFRQIAGGWEAVYTVALPFVGVLTAAFLLPIFATIAISSIWPSQRIRTYPDDLALPRWFARRREVGIGPLLMDDWADAEEDGLDQDVDEGDAAPMLSR